MLASMATDWATISALATAGGTLVLAVATFSSVRSSNRSARVAEQALLVNVRPLLMPSRLEDPAQKINWFDQHWTSLKGARASVQLENGRVYLAASLRNAGAGVAIIHGWHAYTTQRLENRALPEADEFRPQTRDLYVPSGDVGFWQAAVRDSTDPQHTEFVEAVEQRRFFVVTLLYSDQEGGQRTISRFLLSPTSEGSEWLFSVNRHHNLDRPDPR
jgi:hypothetical protein